MIRFSVCIETIFTHLPLEERMRQAASCGADAVEFWDWKDKDLDLVVRAKESAGVNMAAMGGLSNAAPNDPAAAEAARNELLQSIEVAREIGAAALIIPPGKTLDGIARDEQLLTLERLLADAAPAAAGAHISLLLEPLNARIDHPGVLLSATAEAAALVTRVNQPNVALLFDIYHQYVTEGYVLSSIESHIARIGHFHIADVPGRGEPGTGAADVAGVIRLIDSLGYKGYVGLEFYPRGDHAQAVRLVTSCI